MSEVWSKWERQVINGVFPLRRFLGASDHSAVFLTEYKTRGLANAAIKLMPAHPAHSDAQLARWKTAATLSHEHVLRVFDSGRCQLGGGPFLYLLMEYAEENLAQVLPQRPLTAEEARGLLEPALQGLAYLHGRGLAHGQLKPPNILVIGDQVKLASDTIRPVGQSSPPVNVKWTPYDPPEARAGTVSSAGDVWGLGVMLVEALTQSLPVWPEGSENVSLPLTLPSKFVDTVRRCLSRNPSARPTVAGFEARIRLRPMGDDPPVATDPGAAPPAQVSARPAPAAPAKSTTPETSSPAATSSRPATTSNPASASTSTPTRASASSPAPSSPAPSSPAPSSPAPSGPTPSGPPASAASSPAPRSSEGGRSKVRTSDAPRPSSGSKAGAAVTSAAAAAPSPTAQRDAPIPSGATKDALREVAPREPAARPSYVPQIVAIVVVFAIIWALLRLFSKPHRAQQPPPTASQPAVPVPQSSSASSVADSPSSAATGASTEVGAPSPTASHGTPRSNDQSSASATAPGVLHEEVPSIASSARNTIRGHIRISVRVTTDRTGNVVGDVLETAGPSKYFARQVAAAARKWKFAPVPGRDSQQWLLWFELTREGSTAHATPES